jgi:hypothetical protein
MLLGLLLGLFGLRRKGRREGSRRGRVSQLLKSVSKKTDGTGARGAFFA